MIGYSVHSIVILCASAWGRPQEKSKVLFRALEEAQGQGGCTDGLFWPEDQGCYTPGEQGPCPQGQVIDIVEGRPGCREQLTCQGDKVPFKGSCYQLASTGPCAQGEWLVLAGVEEGVASFQCQKRKCAEDEVYWAPSCSCLAPQTIRAKEVSPCGEGGQLLISPYGEGMCGCQKGWEVGFSHGFEGGNQGVCRRLEGNITTRGIFDNIPVNDSTAYRRATRLNCYVDEAGNCRRVWIKPRFQAEGVSKSAEDLIEWLESFEKPVEECSIEEASATA